MLVYGDFVGFGEDDIDYTSRCRLWFLLYKPNVHNLRFLLDMLIEHVQMLPSGDFVGFGEVDIDYATKCDCGHCYEKTSCSLVEAQRSFL